MTEHEYIRQQAQRTIKRLKAAERLVTLAQQSLPFGEHYQELGTAATTLVRAYQALERKHINPPLIDTLR